MASMWNRTHARIFRKRLTLAAGLIVVVAVAYAAKQSADEAKPTASAGEAQGQPAFAGWWKLNKDESDDPGEKLRSAVQDRDRNGPMSRPGGMGGGGVGIGIPGIGMGRPGGPGNGPRSGSGSEEEHGRLRELVQASDQLRVAQKGPEIDMTDDASRVRELFTDGRKIEKSKKDSQQTQVKARWERATLVTEEKGPSGEKISHSYELTAEGKLADTLTLESKHLNTPIIVRSVYDKSGPEKSE